MEHAVDTNQHVPLKHRRLLVEIIDVESQIRMEELDGVGLAPNTDC